LPTAARAPSVPLPEVPIGRAARLVVRELVVVAHPVLLPVGERGAEAERAPGVEHIEVGDRGVAARLPTEGVLQVLHLAVEAAFLEFEGAARNQVDRAAERIGVHVRRQRLDDFNPADHLGGDEGKIDGAVVVLHRRGLDAVRRGGEPVAVEGDGVVFGGGAAHVGPLIVDDVDAGEPRQRLADRAVGQVADGVGGDDVGNAAGGALLVDGAGLALADARDGEGVHHDRAVGEAGVDPRDLAVTDLHGGPVRFEAEVGGFESVGAGGKIGEMEAAFAVGDRLPAAGLEPHRRPGQRAAVRGVGEDAGERAGGQTGDQRQEKEDGEAERANRQGGDPGEVHGGARQGNGDVRATPAA
jgi:hypothetical protein